MQKECESTCNVAMKSGRSHRLRDNKETERQTEEERTEIYREAVYAGVRMDREQVDTQKMAPICGAPDLD